jgi:hypothetical protein
LRGPHERSFNPAKKSCAFAKRGEAGIFQIIHVVRVLEKSRNANKPHKQIMTKLPKILLAVSLTALATGFVVTFGPVQAPLLLTAAMPLGAVCLGLFLVTFALQKEVAGFDEEQRVRLALAQRNRVPPSPRDPARNARGDSALVTASAH